MTRKRLDDFGESLWITGHLRGAASELDELAHFLDGEREILTSSSGAFARGGAAALALALIHIRQRARELERAARNFDAVADDYEVELPEVHMLAVVRLVPDTDVQCNECGALPTVRAMFSDGGTHNSGRCGPCFFGNVHYRDPGTWNADSAKG